jgi:hypothetical protein
MYHPALLPQQLEGLAWPRARNLTLAAALRFIRHRIRGRIPIHSLDRQLVCCNTPNCNTKIENKKIFESAQSVVLKEDPKFRMPE